MHEWYKEEGDFVQIHAGLTIASQESPTQTGLPSRSNCALLCLKLRNAKNSCCDLTQLITTTTKKTLLQLFVLSSPVKGSRTVSQILHCLGDHSKSGRIKQAISKLAKIWMYIKWQQTKDTEAKLLLRGWSSLPLAVQGTLLHWPSFIRQA